MANSIRKKSEGQWALGLLREISIVVVAALIASTLLRLFLLQVFVIPSRSMENTLLVGDRVAVQKVSGVQRGDVVVFRDDYGWLPVQREVQHPWWQTALKFVGLLPDDSQNYLIKRLVGLPGDHVVCCDQVGRVTVNGKALDETPYLYKDSSGAQVAPSEYTFDVVVPEARIFVMGDHRNDSADSRCHLDEKRNGVAGASAFVPLESVVGSAVGVVLPFDRIGGLGRPATFGEIPAASGPPPAQGVVTGDLPPC